MVLQGRHVGGVPRHQIVLLRRRFFRGRGSFLGPHQVQAREDSVNEELGSCKADVKLIDKLSDLADGIDSAEDILESAVAALDMISDITAASENVRDRLIPAMQSLRELCDQAETLTARSFWPFPTYGDLLFGV